MVVMIASLKAICITAAAALAVLLLILFVYRESRGFKVVRYSFVNRKLKVPHFRMALISDLHDCDLGNDNRDVLKALDEEAPDAVFLAGDMITSGMEPECHDSNALKFIERVAEKYTVYYGIGNHEEKLRRCPKDHPGEFERLCSRLDKIGAPMLLDEKVSIDEAGIDIYGLDLSHEYYRRLKTRQIPDDHLDNKLGSNDTSRVSVLIAHNPEHFDKYALWKPDFVLSGHVHGGIINLPLLGGVLSPQLKLFPRYDAGVFLKDGSTMILTRGLGTHTIPVRVFNKAEIVIADIYRDQKDFETEGMI
ncbi:MAG: metallophosphoesterase [Lachnospiraceae bacterium]|nr:metallophosphoesterase [Lachnospiraceae bacterium]